MNSDPKIIERKINTRAKVDEETRNQSKMDQWVFNCSSVHQWLHFFYIYVASLSNCFEN